MTIKKSLIKGLLISTSFVSVSDASFNEESLEQKNTPVNITREFTDENTPNHNLPWFGVENCPYNTYSCSHEQLEGIKITPRMLAMFPCDSERTLIALMSVGWTINIRMNDDESWSENLPNQSIEYDNEYDYLVRNCKISEEDVSIYRMYVDILNNKEKIQNYKKYFTFHGIKDSTTQKKMYGDMIEKLKSIKADEEKTAEIKKELSRINPRSAKFEEVQRILEKGRKGNVDNYEATIKEHDLNNKEVPLAEKVGIQGQDEKKETVAENKRDKPQGLKNNSSANKPMVPFVDRNSTLQVLKVREISEAPNSFVTTGGVKVNPQSTSTSSFFIEIGMKITETFIKAKNIILAIFGIK